ncbi:MAG: hypothetical protein ACRDTE_14585 [Pseudonocardiaceae bacterium]
MSEPLTVRPGELRDNWGKLFARLDDLERSLGSDERYQWQVMLSELLCTARSAVERGRLGPEVWHDLIDRAERLADPGILFRGPAPALLSVDGLRAEFALARDAGVARTGTVGYVRGDPLAVAAQRDPDMQNWVSDLLGEPVVQFGSVFYYVFERPGDELPTQLHEFAMRRDVPGVAPVIAVSVLLERTAPDDGGRLYRVDRDFGTEHLDSVPGDCTVYRATGTVHGRTKLSREALAVNLLLRFVPVSRG